MGRDTSAYLKFGIVLGAYFISARIGLMQDAVSGFAALVWPPSGIALASILLLGTRVWPMIVLGAFFVNLLAGAPVVAAVAISAGNTLEALGAAYLLQRIGFRNELDRQRDVIALLIAACLGAGVGASLGVSSLAVAGVRTFEGFWQTWRAWWVGDALGILIIAPLISLWASKPRENVRGWRILEALVLSLLLGAFGQLIFGPHFDEAVFFSLRRPYALFPFVIWGAFRFGQIGSVTVNFAICLFAIVGTELGYGPFVHSTLRESLLHLHTFTGIVTVTGLFLAASVLERRRAVQDREKAERDLIASHADLERTVAARTEELKDLYNNAPCGYHSIAEDGTYLRINDTELSWLGYTREEVVGKMKFSDISTQKSKETFNRLFSVFLKQGWIQEVEFELIRKDGSTFPVLLNSTVVRDSQGKFLRTRATVFDITERKMAENKLHKAHEELEERVLLRTEALLHAIKREQTARNEVEFMARASQILGESLDYRQTLQNIANLTVSWLADWCVIDLVLEEGAPSKIAIAHPDPEKQRAVLALQEKFRSLSSPGAGAMRVISSGKSELYPHISEDMLRMSADSEEHFRTILDLGIESAMVVPMLSRGKTIGAITLIHAESGRSYTAHDLELAEELGRRAGQAVDNAFLYAEAQKAIRIRDEFLSIASHELKTPLTSLKLQTQLRLRNFDLGKTVDVEKQRRSLESDNRQIDRLSRLIDDMLDVSRLHAGKFTLQPEKLDLCGLVREVVDRHAPQLEASGCRLTVDLCEPVMGSWDRDRIEQVVTNLLTNAMKYGAGKPVYVRTSRERALARITVRDEGIGIARENQSRIFKRFERAVPANEVSGMGLGLFIASEIVTALNGKIYVESELGRGSTFIVELPIVLNEDVSKERRAPFTESASL